MIKRKICVVTGTRAEYGLFYPILKKIQASESLELYLVATTMHLSSEFGLTYKQIEKDGFRIDDKIENLLSADSKSSVAKSTGLATILLSDSFNRLHPDVVLLLGDRYETHAAATTAMLMNIPIAHIHGGEITEGAVDEQIRHSISKMSYLHFTSTQQYRQRVIQMGEDPSRVYHTGAPGIDNIMNMKLMTKADLEADLGWNFGVKSVLFTYHPTTLSTANIKEEVSEILHVIDSLDAHVLFTYANADDGGKQVNQQLEEFCGSGSLKYKVVKNLGQLRYLSAMKHVDILLGNTSSGIIEAASFQKPVVNIGDRQKGRLQSGNVIDCDLKGLMPSITQAFSEDFQIKCNGIKNIYGCGDAAAKICNVLQSIELSGRKRFIDVELLY